MHLILRIAACLSAAFLTVGCSSSDAKARAALSDYQAAAAANDMVGARMALLQLVRAKDDVADYWVQLGKVQATMGSYSDAYYSFTRAYELNRSDPDVLRAVTELALRAGDIGLAQSHAQELQIVAPNDPWIKLTEGWSAIAQNEYDKALAASDSLLANSPYDPSATGLKARALIGLDRKEEAEALLIRQVQAQPSDSSNLLVLAKIYQGREDWPKVAQIAGQLTSLNPDDTNDKLLLAEANFRSGNMAAGRQVSLDLLKPNADSSVVSSVLDLWSDYWPSPQKVEDVRRLAFAAPRLEQRLVYARFLSRNGRPSDAVRLSSAAATLPVSAKTAEANAVLADALSRGGNFNAAKSRFDAVLAYDPGNATALRGRAELEVRTGHADAAVIDAQKLVTVLPTSSRDRILLAQSYSAAGKGRWADRTLWAAFQEIPADEKIYAALQATKKGNAEGLKDLEEEFTRQRNNSLNRGFM
jgi:tetratricopeptide (TPR) repeat protein